MSDPKQGIRVRGGVLEIRLRYTGREAGVKEGLWRFLLPLDAAPWPPGRMQDPE